MNFTVSPLFLLEIIPSFGGAIAFCLWALWDLRKENRAAAARDAARAALAAARANTANTASMYPTATACPAPRHAAQSWTAAPVFSAEPPFAESAVPETPEYTTPHSTLVLDMSEVHKQAWDAMPVEEVTPLIGRRLITSEHMMLAHVYLKQGALVSAHEHHNEQFTYVLSGALRFWIGEHADNPGDVFTDVRAGEVLVIPGNVRHRAEALEDTLDVDIFNPPRQDWIDKTDDYLRTGK